MENLNKTKDELLKELEELKYENESLKAEFQKDITDRKQTENTLRISEDRYRDLVENSNDLICTHDLDGNLLTINSTASKISGYSEEELLNMNFKEILDPEYLRKYDLYLKVIKNRGKAKGTMAIYTKSGERRYWEFNNTLRTEGVPFPIIRGTAKDITESKRAEEALLDSEENFRTIFEANSAAMAIIDPDTTITMVNDAYCQMGGYSREEVIGMSWTLQIPPEDLERLKEYNRLRILNPDDAPRKYEFSFYHKSGEIKNTLMSVSTFKKNNKIITSFIDITERKKAEEELRNKMEELERFHKLTVGREMRMIELKKEVNELSEKLGIDSPHKLDFIDKI